MSYEAAAVRVADSPPLLDTVLRAALLLDFNTRVVCIGMMAIGVSGALAGTFLVLRRRALVAETLGHSTLAGVCAVPLVLAAVGGVAATTPTLVLGGLLSGVTAILTVQALSGIRGMRADSAMAVTLGTFFGVGTFLLGIVQQLRLERRVAVGSFINGKASAMNFVDCVTACVVAATMLGLTIALLPRLRLLAFDPGFARAKGLRPERLDAGLALVTAVVAALGMQAVGLILVVSLFIAPPLAARCFSNTLTGTLIAACSVGALSTYVGGVASAVIPRLPTGPVVVLTSTLLLGIALLVGPCRPARRASASSSAVPLST